MIAHYFKVSYNITFTDAECVQDVSDENFEEVSCELSDSSNFKEHVDVMTTYLGRYMAQGGPRTFYFKKCNFLRWEWSYNRVLV